MPIDKNVKSAFHRMANGVFVVGASHGGHVRGFTATWVFQASFRNPLIVISVDKTHDTYPLIEASKRFTVSVLSDEQADVARYFGRAGKEEIEEAEHFESVDDKAAPEVKGAIAVLKCSVVSTMDAIDHSIFLGEVTDARTSGDALPLVYWPAGGFHAPQAGRL